MTEEENISNMKFVMPQETNDVSLPNDKILVSALDPENKTFSGLILDPRHYDKFKKGVVVLTGPGNLTEDETKRIPLQLSKGDVVLFDTSYIKEININNKVFNIFNGPEGLIAKIGEVNQEGEVELYANTKI